jgi:hypothetical protein
LRGTHEKDLLPMRKLVPCDQDKHTLPI